ncbi:M23 family metallopeptidase [Rhizobium sp. 1399]|uniref:M23 family metallopeptidase n=1 Tax=Rhizobium sp. 1399 TaxID=2817758 RepID=UPI0028565CF5|nr:M23 family metallopeptidase [Rhizobium sp. 1399]MDR6670222.1 murein DD-endopeptidase MepM/ murein hydrolase activator NlpD [Rhizobium sp. 1399]
MGEDIEVPNAMFTPAETPILPAGLVTTTPFTTALYPVQLEGAAVLGRAGELRGFYANNRWKPKWSGFMFPRTPVNSHGGVDIFAPHGTPIVAMTDGEVEQRTTANDMGLRVHLRFTFAGVAYRFILGHLDRFDGGPQSVSKGTIVGYAGCTGNAAGAQPCLTPNLCGKYSTHLHLQLKRDADGKLLDPLRALGWALSYDDDDRDVPCDEA